MPASVPVPSASARPRRARRRLSVSTIALVAGAAAAIAGVAWLALRPVRVLNVVSAVASHRTATGVRYGPLEGQRFDLYQPADKAVQGGVPLVVFVHGGSWQRGDRGDYRFVGEALAARGVAVAVIDYRQFPEVTYPAFLEDVARAVDHALSHAAEWGADPHRVFVMGHSAGAYNAAMIALDPRWLATVRRAPESLAGWVGLAGPYDFLPIHDPDVKPVFHDPDVPLDSQPMRHAESATAPRPAFLAAPEKDSLVNPVRSTQHLGEVLASRGGSVEARRYPDVDHFTLVGAMSPLLASKAPVLADVVDFLRNTPATTR